MDMKQEELHHLAIAMVKNACHKYWIEKDASLYTDYLYTPDSPVVGLDSADVLGTYAIEKETYHGFQQSDTLYLVTGNLEVYNVKKMFTYKEIVDVMALCTWTEEGIRFSGVHMSIKKKTLFNNIAIQANDYYYKRLLYNLCDVFMEIHIEEDTFEYDMKKYEALFHETPQFDNMDQWFWHMCHNVVVEQDLEKLDLFRDTDIEKRLAANELLIDTNFRIKRDDDEIRWLNMMIVFIPDEHRRMIRNVFVLLKDCTNEMSDKMRNLEFARTDGLTQIWNRRYTEELIKERIAQYKQGIFMLLDVDKFKDVNDSYGHITGDDLLMKISSNISDKLSKDDVFGRLGGDEFVLYLVRKEEEAYDEKHIEEVFRATQFCYSENDIEMDIHCSAGAVFFKDNDVDFETLYKEADKTLYAAKKAGRNTIRIEHI